MQTESYTYKKRIRALHKTKMEHTAIKQKIRGSMNFDDHGIIPPPTDQIRMVNVINTSGEPVTDWVMPELEIESNHTSGGFYGPKVVGRNFRKLLEIHPTYVDPMSSLAGGYMVNFMSYRNAHWNPDLEIPSDVQAATEKYNLRNGIGAVQHFCQDLAIGLELGWGGILKKIRRYRQLNAPRGTGFYDGLEDVVLGTQLWIQRHSEAARRLAAAEKNPQIGQNFEKVADINEKLVTHPPTTFWEACQWLLWFLILARMYNGSGALGKLDELLITFYERDISTGTLTEDEATFHIACLLLMDTAYIQLGGPDASGKDVTNAVSYLTLEAARQIGIPANIGVSVGRDIDPGLLRRGVEIILKDKKGVPKFLGSDSVIEGFLNNGFSHELARVRAYAGCQWYGLPGREYMLADSLKINFVALFEAALQEMRSDVNVSPSVDELWRRYEEHQRHAVHAIAQAIDFHIEHMHTVYPELVMDLLCHGPIEKGVDATHGGVEYYHLGVDGAGLATVADSFAAVEQWVEKKKYLTWNELFYCLGTDWGEPGGERIRLMMKSTPRYGSGGSRADEYAVHISRSFTETLTAASTPNGHKMIPGLFSWANTIGMGKKMGATPNGRKAGEPISHGSNPDPGFRKDGAPTALAKAIAEVQPGYGNTAPMQIELDPGIYKSNNGVETIMSLVKGHFYLGGTQINMNILDREKLLECHEDPSKCPDLIVRVTGFSAYFASLSREFRQLVINRLISD